METSLNAFLTNLNNQVIFVNFLFEQDDKFVLFAAYFSYTINFKIRSLGADEMTEKLAQTAFTVTIKKTIYSKNSGVQEVDIFPSADIKGLSALIKHLNAFIKLSPFKIIKHGKNCYQLLDPEGMDYIGEYVSLSGAIKTCDNNYVL